MVSIERNLIISGQSDGQGWMLSGSFVYDPENRLVSATRQSYAGLPDSTFGGRYLCRP